MGLYDRDYMRDSDSSRSVPRIVLVLGVVVSLITASSYLMKEFRLFSRSKPKAVAHQPTEREQLLEISPLDLNTAAHKELRLLPGVSDSIAEGIMAARPLLSIEQLDDVFDIGPKTVEAVRPHVFVNMTTIKERFPDYDKSPSTTDGDTKSAQHVISED